MITQHRQPELRCAPLFVFNFTGATEKGFWTSRQALTSPMGIEIPCGYWDTLWVWGIAGTNRRITSDNEKSPPALLLSGPTICKPHRAGPRRNPLLSASVYCYPFRLLFHVPALDSPSHFNGILDLVMIIVLKETNARCLRRIFLWNCS